MNKMISIIVPIYKVEQFLPECIESILAQTYQDWECILVDDGSPDNSGKIADEYTKKDKRIKAIHVSNGGVTAARRIGVDCAEGEWIFFVDGDDKIPEDALQILVALANIDSTLDVIEGAYRWFYPEGPSKVRNNIAMKQGKFYANSRDYVKGIFSSDKGMRGPVCKLIRKSVLVDTCALDVPRFFTNGEDMMMNVAMAHNIRKYVLLPDIVYEYRQQFGYSAIMKPLSWEYYSEYMQFMRKILFRNPSWNDVWVEFMKHYFSYAIHGRNSVSSIPETIRSFVIPELWENRNGIPFSDKLLLFCLKMPRGLRELTSMSLLALFKMKRVLLGSYYAKRSRKE